MMHTAEIVSAVCSTPWRFLFVNTYIKKESLRCAARGGDHFLIEYLGKIETEFKNTLGCLSGAQIGSNLGCHPPTTVWVCCIVYSVHCIVYSVEVYVNLHHSFK